MNIISAFFLAGAIIAAAIGLGELEVKDGVPGDTLWKFTFLWALLLSLHFVPWGRFIGGIHIGSNTPNA